MQSFGQNFLSQKFQNSQLISLQKTCDRKLLRDTIHIPTSEPNSLVKGIQIICPPMDLVLEFFISIFHTGVGNSFIGTVHSDCSSLIEPVNGLTPGKQPQL